MFYHFFKRVLDILLSFFGIIGLSLFFIGITILLKRENRKAPVLFKQTRVGKNGSEFIMYKFRSMDVDAEEQLAKLLHKNEIDGAMFKIKDDPRVTKVGKFIRKTSLDELPQLLNVIEGHMSLIGPRPPLPREVAQYSTYDKQRLLVKPGCSGLWQVNGRNDVDFKDMVKLDLEYIKNQSLKLDLSIILKTIKVMIKAHGAY